jgi:hypothetical protein
MTSGDLYDLWRRLDQLLTCRQCCLVFFGHAPVSFVVGVYVCV